MNLIPLFQKWRPFINRFEKTIEDFNFGTLLRIDCTKDYSEENSILGEFCLHVHVHCIFKAIPIQSHIIATIQLRIDNEIQAYQSKEFKYMQTC